jgi:hypothetical protein
MPSRHHTAIALCLLSTADASAASINDPATQIAFYGVPLSVWLTLLASLLVAVISAATAMIVVWRSSANARTNLREQIQRDDERFKVQLAHDSEQLERRLAHEADQRERERKMSLRRDVFLEAAAALTLANSLIGRIANLDNDQKALGDELITHLSKIMRVQIVGSQQTIQAVADYIKVLGPSFTEMLALRIPLMTRKSSIDLEGTFVDSALAERKRFTAMMQQLNLDRVTDPAKWEPILAQSNLAAETYASHAATKDELEREQTEGVFAIVRHSLVLAEKLGRLLPPALLAVRSEMDMPLDPEWYTGLWSEQTAHMRIATENFLASIERPASTPPDDISGG